MNIRFDYDQKETCHYTAKFPDYVAYNGSHSKRTKRRIYIERKDFTDLLKSVVLSTSLYHGEAKPVFSKNVKIKPELKDLTRKVLKLISENKREKIKSLLGEF